MYITQDTIFVVLSNSWDAEYRKKMEIILQLLHRNSVYQTLAADMQDFSEIWLPGKVQWIKLF